MELFDTHAHYDDEKFNDDRNQIIKEIYAEGITRFVSAGYDVRSSETGLKLALENDYIYTISGISPNDISKNMSDTQKQIDIIEKLLVSEMENSKLEGRKPKIVGIGEIGLDYYWNKENKDIQKQAFISQIKLANKYNLPIIIHTREGHPLTGSPNRK